MRESDLLEFASRDWEALAAAKAEHWANRKKSHGPADALRAAGALRDQVATTHPGWPTARYRQEDLATHTRVAACLRRVLSTQPD